MKTTFLRWLEKRPESVSAFHLRTGLPLWSLYTLAGMAVAKTIKRFDPAVLKAVESETGIKWHKLHDEALAARNSLVAPRKYERRQKDAAE